MSQEERSKNHNEALIKFLAPRKLKRALKELAAERNIALGCPTRTCHVGLRQAYTQNMMIAIANQKEGHRKAQRRSIYQPG